MGEYQVSLQKAYSTVCGSRWEWQVIGSSWVLVPGLHPAEPAQVPMHSVTQCSKKRDELWWHAVVTLQTQIMSSIDSCCQFLLRNRSANEAEESQWLWGIQLSRPTGPQWLAVEHSTKSLKLALEAIQLCLCRAASEWGSWEQPKIPKSRSWRSWAGCMHPGHTIHHSYQKPTAESKLPAHSGSHKLITLVSDMLPLSGDLNKTLITPKHVRKYTTNMVHERRINCSWSW